MLCMICTCMLRGGTRQQWTGTYDLTFTHHTKTDTLRRSKQSGCSICTVLANEVQKDIDLLDDQDISVAANLSKVTTPELGSAIYRLDFILQKKRARTFVLVPQASRTARPTFRNNTKYDWLRTPKSSDTSSDEVIQLVKSWINRCNEECDCAGTLSIWKQRWYPDRLIDLRPVRKANGLKEGLIDLDSLVFLSEGSSLERTKVKLVDEKALKSSTKEEPNLYVTLSHCWGKPRSAQSQLKLTSRTQRRFEQDGIELRELSRTFREAILFASRLENVGYIWIDSLCIKQQLTDTGADEDWEAEEDWREQSRVMDQVYHHAYLNISATAAVDGDKGLFQQRRPEELWEDEISLNVSGLIGPQEMKAAEQAGKDCLERCTIIDVSFWNDLVEQAPVNRRGWVLQERLMAPRVVHFCANQVAWECAGFQGAEGHPEGLPALSLRLGSIVDEGRFKNLTRSNGLRLRRIRLNDFPDPDQEMDDLWVFELWKRVAEAFSRLSLTMSRDKLVALSGIARHFHQLMNCDYLAGLWRNHLESQLLWHVNEVFEDGEFKNGSKRVASRAPSFAWTSLDTPHGITYGEATDYRHDPGDLLFKVSPKPSPRMWPPVDTENEYGMIDYGKGQVTLIPRYLAQIKLRRLRAPQVLPYCFSFTDTSQSTGPVELEYYNLYLDAPDYDTEIFAKDAKLYCMPAAYGERTVKRSSRYLLCLLLILQRKEGSRMYFKRFGLAKLSNHSDVRGQEALRREVFGGRDIVIE